MMVQFAPIALMIFTLAGSSFAAKSKSTPAANPMINTSAAMTAWKSRPRANETTSALEKRLRGDISALLAKDPAKLDYDVARWRLLSYLRELPWKNMSSKWKKWYLDNQPNPRLSDEQRTAYLEQLKNKKLFEMSPKEVDVYIAHAQQQFPNLRERVVHLARKNINQPYKIYLLGEFPYEVYDADPLYSLKSSDCVVFSEHTYAMALSRNWNEFFKNLQKLRYKNGEVGMTTRNHFTEADWNKNNSWLIEDVTNDIGATTVTQYTERIDRAAFFKNFGVGQDVPVEVLHDTYIPASAVESVLPKLQDGDFVNVVRGRGKGVWVGHVGMIGHDKNSNVTFIHSTDPKVKEQPIMEYVNTNLKKNIAKRKKGSPEFQGFKFLRLRDEPLTTQQAAAPANQ